MTIISAEWLNFIEVLLGMLTLVFAIYQFFNIRNLKKFEKKLLLYSRFFYLEAIFSTARQRLERLLAINDEEGIPVLNRQELAKAYKLDGSVPNIISEISELSYCCFDRMSRETAKKVQDFLGCASEAYCMLNSFYGVIEKGNSENYRECAEDFIEMTTIMRDGFDSYRIEMYAHCIVKDRAKYIRFKD